MPELLIELLSEEIPARMQKRAEDDLARALKDKLAAAGIEAKAIKTFSGPRRLVAVIDDLPARTPDVSEERKGPRVGSPEKAIEGFLRGAGLASIDQAQIVEDKKGAFYVARIDRKGAATADLLRDVLPDIIRAFPWPKSMRSGESNLLWVRPLQNIACVFDGVEVVIDVDGVPSRAQSRGHRFHAPDWFAIQNFADYAKKLEAAHVMLDREARKAVIAERANALCAAKGLALVEDAGLLEEVAGLVEWPVPLLGDMDAAFLDLPADVIRLTMRTHQRYFAVRDAKTGALAPHFVTVANIEAKDGGAVIAKGNRRVLSARLNDARFFWEQDRKTPLFTDERKAKLQRIVFHQKLGSVWDKVERVKALALELCDVTGANRDWVAQAADLCKMDLVTETVQEFPELQGQIGRQLYLEQFAVLPREGGGDREATGGGVSSAGVESIAAAIEDHYRPLGPNDRVPTDKVAITLALADKLDTLVGFWVIDEKPTGSSDPFGLRRAALGFVRIVLERHLRLPLEIELFARAVNTMQTYAKYEVREIPLGRISDPEPVVRRTHATVLAFLADRLKVQLRDQGKRHDLVDAVFALGDDDLVRIVARVEALDAFLKNEDGANLLAGYRRAANILAAEDKKGKGLTDAENAAPVDSTLLQEPAEKALAAALHTATPAARAAVGKEDFAAAMKALSALRAPVDAFFDAVLVNAPEPALRRNRLKLLLDMRDALHAVADFSKIEG
ncbi:MAG: glycine--tRNA ligase subunit beta [Alphaproteobacteria bacterium]|nr:glycine--tRNA ligase subunit beta [Alphaproteobacteria bacterium]